MPAALAPVALAAYEIGVNANGSAYQPDAARPLSVTLRDGRIAAGDHIQLWRIGADGQAKRLDDCALTAGEVRFDAAETGVYAVVETIRDLTAEGADMSGDRVTIEYDNRSGIPAGAALVVSEAGDDEYTAYLNAAASALGVGAGSLSYAKALDIAFVKDGETYRPSAPVTVTVALSDAQYQDSLTAMRVDDGETSILIASASGTMTFETDGLGVFCFADTGLADISVSADVGGNGSVTLSGAMPALSVAEAKPASGSVKGAETLETARKVAKSVICSSLVKTAMFGEDANWGRVLCAIGYSGEDVDVSKIDLSFKSKAGTIELCKDGAGVPFSEETAAQILHEKEIDILVDLNSGSFEATAWGCDLTYDYVKINGDYRT